MIRIGFDQHRSPLKTRASHTNQHKSVKYVSVKYVALVFMLTLALFVFHAFNTGGPRYVGTAATHAAPLGVVTTTTVFADLIANVGGDRVAVTSIVPPGVDPHVFEPTSREARHIATADLLFINGFGLEQWLDKLLRNVSAKTLPVITLADGLTPLTDISFAIHGTGDDHHHGDPHFWLDITHAIHYVTNIEHALIAADPEGAAYYKERAQAYRQQLTDLDAWFFDEMQTVPPQHRVLLTYHDAFSYMAQRYELNQIGVVVVNPDREPAPRELATLIKTIKAHNVGVLFAEPQINPRLVTGLMTEARITVATLYSDALTAAVPTYIDMMRYNAASLLEAWQR